PAIIWVCNRKHLFKRQNPNGNWVGLTSNRTPKDTLAGDRLIQKCAEQIFTKMSICSPYVREISRGKQVKNEPVVSLAQNFHRDTARLLRHQHCAKIIFSSFFHPSYIRFRGRSAFIQNGLRLFYDRNRGNSP